MMRSLLDAKFDESLAEVLGPGGRVVVGHDEQGLPIATNLPPTLPSFFDTFCTLNGAVEALVAGDERLTFAQLNDWSDRLAGALVGRGVVKGDRIAIAMRNCPSWLVVYMAVVKAGAIATLVNGWWQADELTHGLTLSDPRLIVADIPRAARIETSGSTAELITLPIERPLAEALAPLIEGVAPAPLPTVLPGDDATILFTSGSTGDAKGAVSTHRAVTTAVYAYATGLMTLLGILTREGRPPVNPPRTLVSVPFFHVTGEIPLMLNSFVIGRGMVVMAKWDVVEAMKLIEAEKITYFVGVPTMSLELMNHPDHGKYDLSSLTDITAGGAPRPVAHVKRLAQEFPNAQPALGYGLTETNAVGCSNYWSNYADKPASTGRAQPPFVELVIFGEGNVKLPPNERGEVAIRSAANIRGYWKNPTATAAAFTADHWFLTGDVGYLDEEGYLFLVDRKKDIIIRGGENIACAEVEAALYTCPAVGEACVFGAPDDRLGEVPVAVVHVTEGHTLDEAELRAFLEPRLARFKIPARFTFDPAPLPRLGTGKIDRVTLKGMYGH
jgi:long-chain acyl-CoA synthetase